MDHAIIRDGQPVRLTEAYLYEGPPRAQYALGTLRNMPRAEKLAIGVYEIAEPTLREGVGNIPVGDPVLAVDGDHVTKTQAFRELTAQEIEDRRAARADGLAEQDFGKIQLADMRTTFELWLLVAQPGGTVQQQLAQFATFYRTARRNQTISAAAFKTEMRDIIENGL